MLKKIIPRNITKLYCQSVKYYKSIIMETHNSYIFAIKVKKEVFTILLLLFLIWCVSYLIDLSTLHVPINYNEFHMFYILSSFKYRKNIMLFYKIKSTIWSIIELYRSSNWLEREVFDLFGVIFVGHNNLRRILTDYGFRGFPLRKDFPLFGYKEICYDLELRQIVYGIVKLMQSLRNYFFQRQWML